MNAEEKRHYRTGYVVGKLVREMVRAGKRVKMCPPHDPLSRGPADFRAYSWGLDCGMRGSSCLF